MRYLIDRSDIILFDVTNLSENIEWELKTVMASVPPDRVLFLFQKNEDLSTEQMQLISADFAKFTGLKKANFFIHSNLSGSGSSNLESRLSEEIHKTAKGETTQIPTSDVFIADEVETPRQDPSRRRHRRRR